MLKEAAKRRKLRRGERNRKRAKMMLTCGAMTLLVIVVTLVMASYPTIQRIFGGYLITLLILFNIIVFVVVDKLVSTGLEGEGEGINCTLTELDIKNHKCRNITHQLGG